MLQCTVNGEQGESVDGNTGFETRPVYNRHEKYVSSLDAYRIAILHKQDFVGFDYKLKYCDEMDYTEQELICLYQLPFACERVEWSSAEKDRLCHDEIREYALKAYGRADVKEKPKLVRWLKPDVPAGMSLYE